MLAVGMVPAAAFATEAEDVQTSDALELLAVSPDDAFAAADWSGAKDNAGTSYDADAIEAGIDFVDDGNVHYLIPTELTYAIGEDDKGTIEVNDKDFTITYTKYNTSTGYWDAVADPEDIKDAGSYKVTIEGAQNGANVYTSASTKDLTWTISATSLDGAYVYLDTDNDHTNGDDTTKTTITYNGANQGGNIWVADKDGTPLTAANYGGVAFYAKGKKVDLSSALSSDTIKDEGTYVAVIKDKSNNLLKEIEFTVAPLDISKAKFTVDAEGAITAVNGNSTSANVNDIKAGLETKLDAENSAASVVSKPGTYNFDVTIKSGATAHNYTGTQGTASYDVVGTELTDANFFYGGTTAANDLLSAKMAAQGKTKTIDHSNAAAVDFDAKQVKVSSENYASASTDPVAAQGDAKTLLTYGKEYTVTITNKDGNEVADATKAGEYTVTVKVNAAATKYAIGGEYSFKLDVTDGTIGTSNVYVTYKGKAVSTVAATYSGKDILPDIAVKVAVGDKTLKEGTDYKLTVLDANKKEVTEIVDEGTYTIKVEGVSYKSADAANVEVTVSAINIAQNQIVVTNDAVIKGKTQTYGFAYTGEAIVPALSYKTLDADDNEIKDASGKNVLAELPAGVYKLTYEYSSDNGATYVAAKEMKEEGLYKVTVVDVKTGDNYTIDAAGGTETFTAEVTKTRNFTDVPNTAWFNDAVYAAEQNGYMTGYAGTKMFGPYDNMTRGQVAVVLYRLAGNKGVGSAGETDGNVDEDVAYPTKFTDVDPHMYYAQAIQWATNRGIVTGYSDTTFGPNDGVSREQFATMLARYEKAINGTLGTVDGDLAAYTDAAAVHSWATESVKWAVGKEIMGKDTTVLTPTKTIIRAEAAAMLVRYQPTA